MHRSRRLVAAAAALMAAAAFMPRPSAQETNDGVAYSPVLAGYNAALARTAWSNVRIDRADLLVTADGVNRATTLFANDRTHQVESLFVARDPRRGGADAISYVVDQSDGAVFAFASNGAITVLPNAVTEARIDASILRWQTEPFCPGPPVVKIADDGTDPDLVDGLVFDDPARIGTPRADITEAGWLPPAFFDKLAPQGSQFILGATFTFTFVDDNGNPTDLDHNGRSDTAFRETYYNLAFPWSEGPSRPNGIDIDTVVTHEAGHAFGLNHFGKVFLDNNNVLKFAPRAVMTAVYVSPFADLTGTDNSSFCAIWAPRK